MSVVLSACWPVGGGARLPAFLECHFKENYIWKVSVP